MTLRPIILTVIFTCALAGALLYFSDTGSKLQDRADTTLAMAATLPDPSGQKNTTTIYKSNLPMPSSISEALATLWIEEARRKRFDPEIAEIVENQAIEPCADPGLVRMEDGNCWTVEAWRKLHP